MAPKLSLIASLLGAGLAVGCVTGDAISPSSASSSSSATTDINIAKAPTSDDLARYLGTSIRRHQLRSSPSAEVFSTVGGRTIRFVSDHEQTPANDPGSGGSSAQTSSHPKIINFTPETPLSQRVDDSLPQGWRESEEGLIHIASGLECDYTHEVTFVEAEDPSAEPIPDVYELFDISIYDDENLDVSCSYAKAGAMFTVLASYYPDFDVSEHAEAAVASIRQAYPVEGELPLVSLELTDADGNVSPSALEIVSGAFDIGEIDAAPYKTALWLTSVGDWHIKLRSTYAQTDLASEIISSIIFLVAVDAVRAHADEYGAPAAAPKTDV